MVPAPPVTRLVCLIGPTASGKSELALKIAKRLHGEIVNADSRQFYRELDIGTAKPSPEDRALIPHHLVDCASIASPWDVAEFMRAANEAIIDIAGRGNLPIVTGGTGLYVRCLLFGLAEIPQAPLTLRTELEDRLANDGLDGLYGDLKKLDPEGANRLHPTDTQRVLRALEVVLHTGRPIHEFWQSRTKALFDHLTLGLNPEREALYRAIDARVSDMAKRGLREEAKALITAYPENPILAKTIGYAEWTGVGTDAATEPAVIADIQANSRQFAKRQLTWFRRESHVRWLDSTDGQNAADEAVSLIGEFLET
jgi:tRNA dimethylallyltransferase